jgi:carboxyl-terminal processing protease
MKSNQITNFILYLCIGVLLLGAGYKLGQNNAGGDFSSLMKTIKGDPRSAQFDTQLYFDTMQKLEDKYVDKSKIDQKKMFYGAVKGMVASVNDPYTFFLTPEENKSMKGQLAGKLEGIGAMLEMKDGNVTIISVISNSPAEQAGLVAGDIIVKVNGNATKGQPLDKVVSQIRGPKGTAVTLTIHHAGKDKEVKITRDEIQTNSITLTYETSASCPTCGKVALLRLEQFGDTTDDEWDKAVEEIQQKWNNKEINGLVMDLRSNPGGYLQSAVYIASDFLQPDQLIVSQVSKEHTTKYTALPSGRLRGIPLSVIINAYSASAAEIFSGSMQDYKTATLVGEKSFGKGSVQEALDLQDGAGLHVTVAKWLLPKGEWIHGKGIQPDIKVTNNFKENDEYSKEKDDQLQKAIDVVNNK